MRVAFQNGGPCANQDVSILILTKDSVPGELYACSDLGQFSGVPCDQVTSNSMFPRFTVVNGTTDCNIVGFCKYNIQLVMRDFNASDVGTYRAEVVFAAVGSIRQRSITKEFSLELSDGIEIQHYTQLSLE